jgi:transposase
MKRFIEGEDRSQSTLFPEHLDDYIAQDNPVRVIDVFVEESDLKELGFEGMDAEATGRPSMALTEAFMRTPLKETHENCPFREGGCPRNCGG